MISRAALSIGTPGEGGLAAPSSAWAHPKAEWAADFRFHRYLVRRARRRLDDHVSVTRSSSHLIAGLDGTFRSVGVNQIARVEGVGAYIGGQVTNKANGQMIGAVNGGSLPNGWGYQTNAMTGIAVSCVGLGTERGLPYCDVRFVGTAGATARPELTFVTPGQGPAAASGDKWAASLYGYVLSGSVPGGGMQAEVIGCVGSSRTYRWLGDAIGANFARLTSIPTLAGTGIDNALPGLSFVNSITSGTAIDFTIRLFAPQVEKAPFASPPILGSNSDATRYASDVRAADMGWFTAASLASSGFSLLATLNFAHVGDGATRRIANFSDGTSNNELRVGIDSSGLTRLTSIVGGAGQVSLPISVAPGVGRYKVAANFVQGAWYLVDSAGNSASIGTGTAPASLSEFRIGQDAGGGSFLNDTVEKLQICRPLSVSEAQAWALAA